MKRISVLLVVFLLLVLAGCGDKTADTSSGGESAGSNADIASSASVEPSASIEPSASGAAMITDTAKPASKDGLVEIEEKLFVGQLNDIYLNEEDYLGKIIKYEGMFTQYTWEENNTTYYTVYRNSPGCCGADGQAGFEVVWPDGANEAYPKENDWCEVVGTLESYDEDGQSYLRIKLDSLAVKTERGVEFVNQ